MVLDQKCDFDPSLTGSAAAGLFGIATRQENSRLIYLPVEWEVTTSYGAGTADGVRAIRQASPQLDLFLRDLPDHYLQGFHLLESNREIRALNDRYKPLAQAIQEQLETTGSLDGRSDLQVALNSINEASRRINDIVYEQCQALDEQEKLFALIGGDHSSPLGQIRYLSEKYQGQFGVLHIDAHHDLRPGYQGFDFSHAAIMHNVMQLPCAPRRLVQVGIRDFCQQEAEDAAADPRIQVFYDEDVKEAIYAGRSYGDIVDEMLAHLPMDVYVSFDIDGLRPDLCPHTGTPVAGGLEFEQARYLIKQLVLSGRRIIGFDLCEVCPNPADESDEWDGNVAARILFLLSSWMLESQQA